MPGNGPVMQGPNSLPGNGPVMQQELNARPQTPYTEPFGQRSPQGPRESLEPRPVSLEAPALVKEAISIDASRKASEAGAETAKRGRKKRTGLTVVVILLLLVLAGGGAATYIERDWVMQFISAPATNQPYQMYQGSSLGISLEYTQGWNVIIDKAHNALRFSDSSYTAQVNLSAAVANGQISDYLNQQSTQLGITGAKAASAVTFAGASWQVVQGSITQKGATYTVVLYATQHGSHFYLLEFLAPPSSFPGMEQSSFAHMRTSLKFG